MGKKLAMALVLVLALSAVVVQAAMQQKTPIYMGAKTIYVKDPNTIYRKDFTVTSQKKSFGSNDCLDYLYRNYKTYNNNAYFCSMDSVSYGSVLTAKCNCVHTQKTNII